MVIAKETGKISATEAAQLKLRQAYLPRFRKALREKRVARYFQIENKVRAAVSYELAAEIPLVKSGRKHGSSLVF